MRKIEVTSLKDGCVNVVEGEWHHVLTERECVFVFGDIPDEGETKTYYIIPAGDVAELEFRKHLGNKYAVNVYDKQGTFMRTLTKDVCQSVFGFEPESYPRRVTDIVHPPDEPKEETVEVNDPDWLSEPDGVGVWWMWDQKSPPVLCSVYDSVSRTGLMCRTFNGREKFTYQLSHEGHVFCRLEYVDLQQWYFKRESEPEPPPMPLKQGWFNHSGKHHYCFEQPNGAINVPLGGIKIDRVTTNVASKLWFTDNGIEITWYGDDA